MDGYNSKKVGTKAIIGIKITKIKDKIKKKYQDSPEFKTGIDMIFDIVFSGILAGIFFLTFDTNSVWLKMLGYGCGLVLFKIKILPMLVQILNSFRLVQK